MVGLILLSLKFYRVGSGEIRYGEPRSGAVWTGQDWQGELWSGGARYGRGEKFPSFINKERYDLNFFNYYVYNKFCNMCRIRYSSSFRY